MCRFFPSLFYGTDFHMIITLLERLIEMIIVSNLMCCKLDGQSSIPGRRIGIIYFTIYPSGFGGLLIGLIPKEKWLECEADCLSVCARVNA